MRRQSRCHILLTLVIGLKMWRMSVWPDVPVYGARLTAIWKKASMQSKAKVGFMRQFSCVLLILTLSQASTIAPVKKDSFKVVIISGRGFYFECQLHCPIRCMCFKKYSRVAQNVCLLNPSSSVLGKPPCILPYLYLSGVLFTCSFSLSKPLLKECLWDRANSWANDMMLMMGRGKWCRFWWSWQVSGLWEPLWWKQSLVQGACAGRAPVLSWSCQWGPQASCRSTATTIHGGYWNVIWEVDTCSCLGPSGHILAAWGLLHYEDSVTLTLFLHQLQHW